MQGNFTCRFRFCEDADLSVIGVSGFLLQLHLSCGRFNLPFRIHVAVGIYGISGNGIHIIRNRSDKAEQIGRTAGTVKYFHSAQYGQMLLESLRP